MANSKKNEVAVIDSTEHLPAVVEIPEGFSELPEELSGGISTPYVQFAYAISDSYRDLVLKFQGGLEEGDAVLMLPTPYDPILLNPFRFFLPRLTEYWAKYDATGMTEMSRRQGSYDDGWRQTFDTVMLVIPPDESRLIPATCRFKNTTTRGAKPLFDAIQKAKTPEWESRNAEIVEAFPRNAWCRVFGHAEVHENKNGRPTLIGQAHPVKDKSGKINYIPLLKDFFEGPNSKVNDTMFKEVVKAYDRRLKAAHEKGLVAA